MKYYVLGGAVVIAAVAALVLSARPRLNEHDQWRYTFVEPETKVRPPRFEQMKFHPGAELREPASAGSAPAKPEATPPSPGQPASAKPAPRKSKSK